MPRPSYNTDEMKVCFFDIDEEDRNITPLSEQSMEKLLKAISYAVERCSTRNIGVRIPVVFATDVLIEQRHLDRIIAHLGEHKVDVRVTDKDLVIGFAKGWVLAIRFHGSSGFVLPNLNSSKGSNDSEFDYIAEGLTQELS